MKKINGTHWYARGIPGDSIQVTERHYCSDWRFFIKGTVQIDSGFIDSNSSDDWWSEEAIWQAEAILLIKLLHRLITETILVKILSQPDNLECIYWAFKLNMGLIWTIFSIAYCFLIVYDWRCFDSNAAVGVPRSLGVWLSRTYDLLLF